MVLGNQITPQVLVYPCAHTRQKDLALAFNTGAISRLNIAINKTFVIQYTYHQFQSINKDLTDPHNFPIP
jgi:hypothetical protein